MSAASCLCCQCPAFPRVMSHSLSSLTSWQISPALGPRPRMLPISFKFSPYHSNGSSSDGLCASGLSPSLIIQAHADRLLVTCLIKACQQLPVVICSSSLDRCSYFHSPCPSLSPRCQAPCASAVSTAVCPVTCSLLPSALSITRVKTFSWIYMSSSTEYFLCLSQLILTGSHYICLLSCNSFYRPGWCRNEKSTCLCFLSTGIKGVHHNTPLTALILCHLGVVPCLLWYPLYSRHKVPSVIFSISLVTW